MSFDVNVLSSKPIIKAAANMQNDGGAGNLGYMSQGRKEQEEKETINIFAQKPEVDSFTLSSKLNTPQEEEFSFKKLIKEVIDTIRSFLKI